MILTDKNILLILLKIGCKVIGFQIFFKIHNQLTILINENYTVKFKHICIFLEIMRKF